MNCSSASAGSWPVSRCSAWPLAAAVVAKVAGHGEHLAVERIGRVVRHEAQVQGHDVDAQQPGEVGDLLHLAGPRGAGRRRHQADGARDGGNVGVALAVEAAEDGRDANAQSRRAGREIACALSGVRVALCGRVQLDRRHAQLVGHFKLHAQARRRCWQTRPAAIFPRDAPCEEWLEDVTADS